MDEVVVIARIVMRQREVLLTLLGSAVVLVPGAVVLARRRGWPHLRQVYAGLAGACAALVPATTLARGEVRLGWSQGCVLDAGLSWGSPEEVLNLVLLAPSAFFAVLATRRVVVVAASALVVAVLVETAQLLLGLGTCQTGDVARNLAGALAACAAGSIMMRPRSSG